MRRIQKKAASTSIELKICPATAERWKDLEQLFGERGACGGCWCMYFRLPRAQWVKQKGAANKRALRELVDSGETPGLLAYVNGQPAGWCALAPRDRYPRLDASRNYKALDSRPVWSVTCFFVAGPYRRMGITQALLEAAADHAARSGATLLEGYPSEPKKGYPDVFYYRGLLSTFLKAGFEEVARRSAVSPMVRRELARERRLKGAERTRH